MRAVHVSHQAERDAGQDTLRPFLDEVARHRLLSPAEQIALAKRIERGDQEAKDRMIVSNLRLVISLARRYQGAGLPLPDLIQDGATGLIRAVEKFDWRRGFRFSTYATWWIRQAIERGLATRPHAIRLPVGVLQRRRALARVEQRLAIELDRPPTLDELADGIGLHRSEVEALLSVPQANVSLDRPVGDEEDTTLADLIAAEGPPVEELVEERTRRQSVHRALAALPDGEREVVCLRFGIGGADPSTLGEIASRLGVTPQRVRQLEDAALERLAETEELSSVRAA